MKVLGVDIKGSEAILCIMSFDMGLVGIDESRQRKLTLHREQDAEQMRGFHATVKKLIEDYKIEHVAIRQRPQKGKFAGGAVGFKMEAAMQLVPNVNVELVTPTETKELIKRNPIAVDYKETGLKQFQELAFHTAYAFLMKQKYGYEPAQ